MKIKKYLLAPLYVTLVLFGVVCVFFEIYVIKEVQRIGNKFLDYWEKL